MNLQHVGGLFLKEVGDDLREVRSALLSPHMNSQLINGAFWKRRSSIWKGVAPSSTKQIPQEWRYCFG